MKKNTLNIIIGLILAGIILFAGILYIKHHVSNERIKAAILSENDCGPQALLFLLSEMGITADLSQIKILAQTDVEGTTLYGLKKAAEYYGLQAMGMKLSYEELRAYLQRGYHAIAFVNNDHYVYIKKDHPEGIVYKDVAPGFQFAVDYQWRKIWYEEEKEQGVVLIIN